jgi:hypothetical protein
MSNTDPPKVSHHATVEPEGGPSDPNRLLPLLKWELEQVMTRVRPQDLSAAELTSLLAVLRTVHFRGIGGPSVGQGCESSLSTQADANRV